MALLYPDPGRAVNPVSRLAAAFGTREANFPSATSMQCWSGVAPVQKQSGKSKVVQFRWARPTFLHQTFVEYARSHYFKRLTALQFEFGSTDYHVARYASLTKS